MKIFIIILLIFNNVFAEYSAKKITKNDYDALLNIDKKIYDLAVKKISYSPSEVVIYIYKNLVFKPNYSSFTVVGTIKAKGIQQEQSTTTQYTNESNSLAGIVTLTYPFFDQKEELAREKKVLDTKQAIIKEVKKYFDIKAEVEDLHLQKEIAIELERRAKSRKLTAVGSFDEWLKTVEDLRKLNKDLTSKELALFESKESMLAMVTPSAKKNLKRML